MSCWCIPKLCNVCLFCICISYIQSILLVLVYLLSLDVSLWPVLVHVHTSLMMHCLHCCRLPAVDIHRN